VDGVDLTILTDMDSATRHWRFLNNGEFDVAEVSGSSYRTARDNGMPLRAIPVPASPVSPWLHVHQHLQEHRKARGPARPEDRRQDDDDHRRAVDARHPAA